MVKCTILQRSDWEDNSLSKGRRMKIELLSTEDIGLYKDLIDEVFGTSNSIEKFRESYRKQNIAKMLLEHIIENAKKEGCRSISLTCLDTAYPAHKLYESLGFEKANSIKFNLNLTTP